MKNRKMSQSHIRSSDVYTAIDNEENDLTKLSGKEHKKMKKLSKKHAFLFIPGFRKSKKTTKERGEVSAGEPLIASSVDFKDPSLSIEGLVKDSDSGKDSDSIGSVSSHESLDSKADNFSLQSSSSSLQAIAAEQRTSSLDSGIDCMPSRNSRSDLTKFNLMMRKGDVIEEQTRGRAPIASPEDDSLLEVVNSHKDSDNSGCASNSSVASFHTLSDCSSSCSCDSCDYSSDSEAEDSVKQSPIQYSSDSDSDLDSCRQTRKRVDDSTDSDSDTDECSGFFTQDKCLFPIPHNNWGNVSSDTAVHSNSVNRTKVVKKKVKTNGLVKQLQKLKVKSGHQHRLVSPSPVCSSGQVGNNTSTPIKRSEDISSFFMNSESAFHTYRSAEPLYINQVHDVKGDFERRSHSHSKLDTNVSFCKDSVQDVKLKRSVSACERTSRPKLRSPRLQVRDRSLNSELLQDQRDARLLEPSLPKDSSKTLADVQQSIEKTAFWIKNNGYDSKPDENSTKSLLKKTKEVNERDLCNEIIGVYFGEESDSSLSSSCLDNSIEQESTTSSDDQTVPPRTIETNIDDFSTAVYVPASYQTAQAKTRKIRNAEMLEKSKTVIQSSTRKLTGMKTVCRPSTNVREKTKANVSCDKPSVLSEQEVDTITKLHTICNGQRVVQYLNTAESPMVHFPPPKRASRISWHRELEQSKLNHHSPRNTPTKPKSALRQRPQDSLFPYVEDKPSPIVITRVRRSKSLSRRSREWPW